ncbi:phospholipid-transporting ATPase ABCA3-like [Haemaphysalis longicornis]
MSGEGGEGDLEQNGPRLGIAALGVKAPSLADALICVGEEHAYGQAAAKTRSLQPSVLHLLSGGAEVQVPVVRTMVSATVREPSCLSRLWALVVKRATYVWRHKRQPLFSWLLPPVMLCLLFSFEKLAESSKRAGVSEMHHGSHLEYAFDDVFQYTRGFVQYGAEHKRFYEKHLAPILPGGSDVRTLSTDVSINKDLLDTAKSNLRTYVFNNHFGIQMTGQRGDVLWYNGQIQHVAPLVLTLYNNARLRNVTGSADAYFSFDVTAPVASYFEQKTAVDEGPEEKKDSIDIDSTRDMLPKVLRSIFFPLSSSLMCSNFIMLPIGERALKVKQLDMLTGVSPLLYWTASYLWDFFFYMGTALLVLPPIVLFHYGEAATSIHANLVLNVLHGYAALPFNYLASFLFVDPGLGFSTLAVCTFIASSLGCFLAVVREHYYDRLKDSVLGVLLQVVLGLFRLLPNFSYSRGMTKLLQLDKDNSACLAGGEALDDLCSSAVVQFRQSLQKCCKSRSGVGSSGTEMIAPFDVDVDSVFFEMLTLVLVGPVLFGLLLLLESNWMRRMEAWFTHPEDTRHGTSPVRSPRLPDKGRKGSGKDRASMGKQKIQKPSTHTSSRLIGPLGPSS